MSILSRTALTVSLGIAASGTPLLAQASAPAVLAATTSIVAPATSHDSTDPRARLARADELHLRGQITAARREYQAVIAMQRAQNALPTEATWKLAELYHAGGRFPERTADLLRQLASDAEQAGDPQVQAKALLEATILYTKARRLEKASACAERLERLMASPHIAEDLRASIQNRIPRS